MSTGGQQQAAFQAMNGQTQPVAPAGGYVALMRALATNPGAFTGGPGNSPFAQTMAANPSGVSPGAAALASWQPAQPQPTPAPTNPIPALMAQQQAAQTAQAAQATQAAQAKSQQATSDQGQSSGGSM